MARLHKVRLIWAEWWAHWLVIVEPAEAYLVVHVAMQESLLEWLANNYKKVSVNGAQLKHALCLELIEAWKLMLTVQPSNIMSACSLAASWSL